MEMGRRVSLIWLLCWGKRQKEPRNTELASFSFLSIENLKFKKKKKSLVKKEISTVIEIKKEVGPTHNNLPFKTKFITI